MTKHDNYTKNFLRLKKKKKNNPQHYKDREGLLTTTDNPNKGVNAVIAYSLFHFFSFRCFIQNMNSFTKP